MIKVEILSVRDPQWTDESRTRINCFVRTNSLEGEHPFTADPNDSEPHGREIFVRCARGDFGPIAEPPPSSAIEDSQDGRFVMPEWIAGWPEIHEFLEEANQENARGTVRGVVLVWGAMLNTVARRYLEEYMERSNLTKSRLKKVYGKNIDNFEGLITVLHKSGLIDDNDRSALDSIRKIRNPCAHRWRLSLDDRDFSAKVLPHFRRLHGRFGFDAVFHEELEYLARMVYSSACAQMAIRLAEMTVRGRPNQA